MKTYPSTELKQNLGDVLAVANREPVAITRHNKPRFVLMSIEAYEARFPRDQRRSLRVEDMPDEHFEMLEAAISDLETRSDD